MACRQRRELAAAAAILYAIILCVTFSARLVMGDKLHDPDARELQSISTDFLDSNSAATIQAMEQHFFSPAVQSSIERIFQSRVVAENGDKVFHYGSLKYTAEGFWRNWKRMMIDGIPTGSVSVGSGIHSRGKFVLFAGDDIDRNVTITHGMKHRPLQKKVTIKGYEYGLANMAVFLSQAMVGGIFDDTCDELNEQPRELIRKDQFGEPIVVYPISNSCGQHNQYYQQMTCPPAEQDMQCPQISSTTTIQSSFNAKVGQRGLMCGPIGTYPEEAKNYKNDFGRTDVQGCCWWGRGPLQSKGLCSMGKLNHYIGAKAFADRRITRSTSGVFPDVDFCTAPHKICETNSGDVRDTEDLRWTVAMFEFAERVQRYSDSNWDYKEKLVKYVNNGMNMNEYYPFDLDHSFIHEVSSIVDRGCHNAPNCLPYVGEVNKLTQRREALTIALSALKIPKFREQQVIDTTLEYLKSNKAGFEETLLRYKRRGSSTLSERYLFDDFVDALSRMAKFSSPELSPFYMGDPWMRDGHKYGLGNIAVFFSNGMVLGIEKDDTCDELNEHLVSGKYPISNSCGQKGLSYQDMKCESNEVPDMACQVDPDMYMTAVTYDRTLGAPPALQCGPRSRIPFTGYWNEGQNAESEGEAFANLNGRTDLEGCCWWGRGMLQMKGPCAFGRMNFFLGARAARENRPSMYEDLDFCINPEAICGSQYRHELVWISALFKWIDQVQNHEDGEWNYLEQMRIFADNGFADTVFLREVNSIVEVGCRKPPCKEAGCVTFPCDGAYSENELDAVNRAFLTITKLGLWDNFKLSLGGSNSPTPAPSVCPECTGSPTLLPTGLPTNTPLIDITSAPSIAPSREVTKLLRRFDDLKEHLLTRRRLLESKVFVSETQSGPSSTTFYTLDGLLVVLRELATKGSDDGNGGNLMFYIGQDHEENFSYGLVNLALFLAHATTRGLRYDSCEELNHDLIDGKLPISNSCGQHSQSYNEDICPMADVARECPYDPTMEVQQTSVGSSGAPRFFCAPKSTTSFTGYFDPLTNSIDNSAPFANAVGRTDVQGCCWWGRGMLFVSGICDIGRFNYIYGLPAFKEGRLSARYNIDFCVYPEALCSDFTIPATSYSKFPTTIQTSDIRYLFALFYWMSNIQDFNWGFWNYKRKLKMFVDGGMIDDSFVDEFSEIVLDSSRDGPMRKTNFREILQILFMEIEVSPSPSITPSLDISERPSLYSDSTSDDLVQPSPSQESVGDSSFQLPDGTVPGVDIQSSENIQVSNVMIVQAMDNPPQTLPASSLLPDDALLDPDFQEPTNTEVSTESSESQTNAQELPPPSPPPFLNSVFEYSSAANTRTILRPIIGICICTLFQAYLS